MIYPNLLLTYQTLKILQEIALIALLFSNKSRRISGAKGLRSTKN